MGASLLPQAVEFAQNGLVVVPIGKDLRPLVSVSVASARGSDPEATRKDFEAHPESGIGLVTGSKSNVTAIVVRDGGALDDLPRTATCYTDTGSMIFLYRAQHGLWTMIAARDYTDIIGEDDVVPLPPTEGVKWLYKEAPAEFPKALLGTEFPIDVDVGDLSLPPPVIEPQGKVAEVTWDEAAKAGLSELDSTRPEDCISMGYDFIDDRITGIFKSELVVVGALTGSGKSTLVMNAIYKAAEMGHKCFVFALEDRLEDYAMKQVYFKMNRIAKAAGRNKYSWNLYRRNVYKDNPDYLSDREKAREEISRKNSGIRFAKVKEGRLNFDDIERVVVEQARKGVELIAFDHLHYVDLDSDDRTRAENIENFVVRLRALQHRTGMRIILVVHFKKTNGEMPTMDSFKDSSAIAHNANYVILLWRDREARMGKSGPQSSLERFRAQSDDRFVKTWIMIPKARNPNGEATIVVDYDRETGEYVDVTPREPRPLSDMTPRRAGADPEVGADEEIGVEDMWKK